MAHSLEKKPEAAVTEEPEIARPRWSTASLKWNLGVSWHRSKILLFIYSAFYLVRHWFDYFCYPWTFDGIFLERQVPSAVSATIFIAAIAWSRRYRRRPTFWAMCLSALVICASDIYVHTYAPGATLGPFSSRSVAICTYMVASAIFGDWKMEPKQNGIAPADGIIADTEAARCENSAESRGAPPLRPHGLVLSGLGSLIVASVAAKLPDIRTAAAVALIAAAATMTIHPPTLAIEYLSRINCGPHITKLDFDNEHFEFTATNKTGTFARICSRSQQPWALERIMNRHIIESDATCGVWCIRQAEDGQFFGYISQVRGGLVDMYYCRGAYGSFGPDCEAEGADYGYDVEREGWMDDIYEPWSVLEEDVDTESAAYDEHIGEDSNRP